MSVSVFVSFLSLLPFSASLSFPPDHSPCPVSCLSLSSKNTRLFPFLFPLRYSCFSLVSCSSILLFLCLYVSLDILFTSVLPRSHFYFLSLFTPFITVVLSSSFRPTLPFPFPSSLLPSPIPHFPQLLNIMARKRPRKKKL